MVAYSQLEKLARGWMYSPELKAAFAETRKETWAMAYC